MMNKIYSDQVEKARMLADGIKKNEAVLKAKRFDTGIVGTLEAQVAELTREAEAIAAEEEALSRHRKQCHVLLDNLKATLADGKSGIKALFDQEQWATYGVPDKR